MSEERKVPQRPRRVVLLGISVLLVVLGLVLVEGVASWLYVGVGLFLESDLSERRHTRHDPELGWVNVPGLRLPDAYGPGTPLTIDRRGFRGTTELSARVPEGKLRVVCLGDSFTLGYGVGDADTWPARLASLGGRLEAVNMGQGGYGPDQAYLWYRRDARELAHDALVFVIVTVDFRRMQRDRFQGYPKPLLGLAGDGRLIVRNVPVPKPGLLQRLRRRAAGLSELRTAQLVLGSAAEDGRPEAAGREGVAMDDDEALRVLGQVFTELRDGAAASRRELLVVLLPTWFDCADGRTGPWYELALREARAHGIPVLDLLPELLPRPFSGLKPLYLDEPIHHMSAAGNAWLAGRVWETLRQRPAIAARLP